MKKTIEVVGITYDLKDDYLKEGYSSEEVAEFDQLSTIEGIEEALQKMGYRTQRLGNVKKLISKLFNGERWDMVFNICEGLKGIGREAQVPAILEAYDIPYVFSDVLVLSLTLHKGMTKSVIRDHGIATADFAVVSKPEDIETVDLPYPLFAKPVAEGTGKGIDRDSRIETPQQLKNACLAKLEKYGQPILVETYLPGREFTVGIIGNGKEAKSVGTMEVTFRKAEADQIYSYDSKANYLSLVDYSVPEKEIALSCEKTALEAWNVLGCRDGGRVDIRLDAQGIPNFIEVNPLAGLNPVDSDLPILARLNGMDYQQLMNEIVSAAVKRISAGQ